MVKIPGILRLFGALALVFFFAIPARSATMFDPGEKWSTLVTPHFRVNYSLGREEMAQLAGNFAEEAHRKLVPWMKSEPTQRTELTILDHEDTVNGLALPLPNNAIYVYLTAAGQDEREFARYETWLKTVITHEYTHILHFESIGGLIAAADKVLGRLIFPNLLPGQPFFLLEGLAVTAESTFATGGRAQSQDYDMILRAATLAGKRLTIDQAGGYYLYDWPGGSAVYIYGTYFYKYLIGQYGADKPPRIAQAYGSEPWLGINQAFKKVLGRDAYQIWDEFSRWLDARYKIQEAAIRAGGLTPFSLVTTSGRYHRHPLYMPDGTLLWSQATGNEFSQVVVAGKELFGKSPFGTLQSTKDGRFLYYSAIRAKDAFHAFDDVYRFDTKNKKSVRLTDGKRASDPAVSPDGERFMAAINGGGRGQLALFDRGGTYLETLSKNKDGTQYGGLTWSPDGRSVVATVWRNGWRDLYLIDPVTGVETPLMRDAAADINPAWTPDGRWVIFASDRSGVLNLHAMRISDRRIYQVTNVLGGALEPTISPDAKTLAFTSYSAKGYDIATMSLQPQAWRESSPDFHMARDSDGAFVAVDLPDLPEAKPERPVQFPAQPYDPWVSLRPKAWLPNVFMSDEQGGGLGVSLFGSDSLLQHTLSAGLGIGWQSLRPQYSLSYTNDQFPPTLGLSLADTTKAYPLSSGASPLVFTLWRQEQRRSGSITYPGIPNRLLGNLFVTGHYFTFGYSSLNSVDLGTEIPAEIRDTSNPQASKLARSDELGAFLFGDPSAFLNPGGVPALHTTNTATLRYQFADSYRYGYSVSPEGGSLFTIDYSKANPVWGSYVTYDHVSADYRTFAPGFGPRHAWAFRLGLGANMGSRDGGFLLGGYSGSSFYNIVDVRALGPFQAFPLRGYGLKGGDHLAALNAEYRIPLGEIQHGVGTLPIFFDRWYGTLNYDAGNVWSRIYDSNGLRQSLGGELRLHMHALNVPLEIRLGMAQGTSPLGPVAAVPAANVPLGAWTLNGNLLPAPDLYWQIGTFF